MTKGDLPTLKSDRLGAVSTSVEAATQREVKFERWARDCQYNMDVAAGKIKGPPIYDWRVLIDGEYRAIFKPGVYKGYNLFDADGRNLGERVHSRSAVPAKAEFEQHIREGLAAGIIPTLAQLAATRAKEQQRREANKAAELERERIERIREAATDMLAALKNSLCPRPANSAPDQLSIPECMARGECGCDSGAAIAKATEPSARKTER